MHTLRENKLFITQNAFPKILNQVCFCIFLPAYFKFHVFLAIELLSDILLHSVYGKQEIERERAVIIREAEEVSQNLQEVVFDVLHAGAFKGTSLARTILGTDHNIKTLTRDDLVAYVTKYYKGPRMVLAAAGGIDHQNVVQLSEKYFGIVEKGDDSVLYFEPGQFSESYVSLIIL